MLLNRDLFEVYVKNWSTKNVLELLRQNIADEEDVVSHSCNMWMKKFNTFWKKIGSRERFVERKAVWLDSPFMVSALQKVKSYSRLASTKSARQRKKQVAQVLETSKVQKRGRKTMSYKNLQERTKHSYACKLAQEHSLEELLRAAEAVAYKNGCLSTKKILKMLRTKNEEWAKKALYKIEKKEESQFSVEKCLMLKTRLSLSKNKYAGIASFMRTEMGQKMVPWKAVMDYRNTIMPKIDNPNENNGYLSVQVPVRSLIQNDVQRILEIEDVQSELDSIKKADVMDCTMYVAAGPDSATGFSHYNQAKFLARDDSLFTEHYMSLKLEYDDKPIYVVPNPQSDMFCRARRMCWTKETDALTHQMYEEFFEEVEGINSNPIIVETENKTLRIKVEAIYSMIDGKAANAIVGNRNTHGCPLCPPYFGIEKMLGPSYFHSRLNAVEWLMRNAAKKAVPGNPAQTHPDVKKEARFQADKLEQHFKMNINRPKIGGSGNSNNGNMARNLLNDPEAFSGALGINIDLVKTLRLMSSLALSSRKLKADKVEKLYQSLEQQIFKEFSFVKSLPPCIHKYNHLAEYAKKLPYTMNFVDEQSGERCHKRHKFTRPHLSRKTSTEDNLMDMLKAALTWSDPKMSYLAHRKIGRTKPSEKDAEFEAQLGEYFYSEEDDSNEMASESFLLDDWSDYSCSSDSDDSSDDDDLDDETD